MRLISCQLVLVFSLLHTGAQGAELSVFQGFYQSQELPNGAKSTTLTLGSRFTTASENEASYLFGLNVTRVQIKGLGTPEQGTGFQLEAGRRWFLGKLSSRVASHATALGTYRNLNVPQANGTIKTSGLFYSFYMGLRLLLKKSFFVDVEARLFESALFSKNTVEVNGNVSETKTLELFADSHTDLSTVLISAGFTL